MFRRGEDVKYTLTFRQRQVLQQLALGKTKMEAAARIGITHDTVKYHLKAIKKRLGTKTTIHSVARAISCGLIQGD